MHCDVGGGYSDSSLGEIPLLWMVDRARANGLAFDPERLALVDGGACDPKLRCVGVQVAPDALGEDPRVAQGLLQAAARPTAARSRPTAARWPPARSAAARERSDYDPPGLESYSGRTITVIDGG